MPPALLGYVAAILLGGMEALFFERDLLGPQKPPQARQPHRDPVLPRQRAAQLLQSQVRLQGQQLQYCRPVLPQARTVVAPIARGSA
jgi:energy-converting hydrogenase Eha subunit F